MGRNNWLGNQILHFYMVTFKPGTLGKPKTAVSLVPAGLKYLLKEYKQILMMPGLLEKFLRVKGLCSCLLPLVCLHHLLKWKKCLEAKLAQFSGPDFPGESSSSKAGRKPYPGLGIPWPTGRTWKRKRAQKQRVEDRDADTCQGCAWGGEMALES